MQTSVYWVYDDAGTLLYVGMTHNVPNRMKQHARKHAPWIKAAATVDIEVFPDRATAEHFEAIAIEQDEPIYNLAPPSSNALARVAKWPESLKGCDYRLPFQAVRSGLEVAPCAYGP